MDLGRANRGKACGRALYRQNVWRWQDQSTSGGRRFLASAAWLVKRSSLVVLFPERPADRQWGPGSRLAYRSALYHLKPTFVVASRPPAAPAFCRVAAADLFATVDGYLGGAPYLPRRLLRRRVLRVQIGASASR